MKNVLIIDDDYLTCKILKTMLADFNCCPAYITETDNIDEILGGFEIDLLITDLMIDNIDGLEVIEKAKVKFPGVPIVAVSSNEEMLAKAKVAGATMAVSKPFQPSLKEELIQLLSN